MDHVVRGTLATVGCVLVMLAGACSSPPAATSSRAQAPPAPLDAGAPATSSSAKSAPDAAANAAKTEPEEQLACPSPSVAAALRSCDGIDAATPTMAMIADATTKVVNDSAKKPRRPQGNSERDRLAPRPLSAAEQAFLRLTRTFLCRDQSSRSRADIAYSEGLLYFQLQHWEEAAVIFDELALGPLTDNSYFTAQLALEAINVLASKLGRTDCEHALAVKSEKYHRHLCTSPRPGATETCAILAKVRDESRQRKTP